MRRRAAAPAWVGGRKCADVGQYKRGLVEEDAQRWGAASGRVWAICLAEANRFALFAIFVAET